MSLKKCARDFGVVLFLMGLLASIPGLTIDAHFLGIFKVNIYTNLLHLATGVIAFVLSHSSIKACKISFQIFGLIYGTLALLGFGYHEADIFGYFANNLADSWVHLAICILSLYLGFLYKSSRNQ